LGRGYDAFGSGSSDEGEVVGINNQVLIALEGLLSRRRRSREDGTLIFRRISEPSGLLISTVFDEVVLSKTVSVTLHKVELRVIVACGGLKLCKRGNDRPCCSGGGITGAVALELGRRLSTNEGVTVRTA